MIDVSKSSSDENNERTRTAKLADMREALEQTVSAQDFSAAAMQSMSENMAQRGDRVSYNLVRNLLDTIEEEQFGTETDFRLETSEVTLAEGAKDDRYPIGGDEGAGRYKVLGHLGSGAAGQVFEVADANFDRRIAVKFLHPEAAQRQERMFDFINEARLTAKLEHPNILPIHDINMSDSGMLYFSMQKAKGKSLKDLLDDAELNGYLGKEIRDINDRVSIIIKVCEAISYAHSRNIVHQDIKPSNIMIGEFGEVVLVDWGTATHIDELSSGRGELVGTPIYMSPEQVNREPSNVASDIYCLGSTLFHILTLRFPTWSEDMDAFWELKRSGKINPLTKSERQAVPRSLMSIVMKAMAFRAENRYATVEELQLDLERFQHGQRVQAHRDSLLDKWQRLYRHNKRATWVACVGVVFIAALSYLLYQELLKSESEWQIFYQEDFSEIKPVDFTQQYELTGFRRFMQSTSEKLPIKFGEAWDIKDGALHFRKVGLGDNTLNLTWMGKIPGDIRLEFDCWSDKDGQPMRTYIAGSSRFQGYHLHAEDGSGQCRFYVTREAKNNSAQSREKRVDGWQSGSLADVKVNWSFEANKVYRYVYERSNSRVRLSINGELLFDVFDIDVLNGPGYQQFGFEMPSSSIVIDNIVAYNRPLAQLVSPLAVADAYFKSGDYEQAGRYYETLKDAYPDTDVRAQSLYRLGRCALIKFDYLSAAQFFQTFMTEFPDHRLREYVLYEMARSFLMRDNINEAETWMKKIRPNAEKRVRLLALSAILHYYLKPYSDLVNGNPHTLKEPEKAFDEPGMLDYLKLIEGKWAFWTKQLNAEVPPTHAVYMSIPFMYIRFGEFAHVEKHYGVENPRHWPIQEVLAITGRRHEILEYYKNDAGRVGQTLRQLGRHEEYLREFGEKADMFSYYISTKQYDKAYTEIDDSDSRMAKYLLAKEDYARIIESYENHYYTYLCAMIGAGRSNELNIEDSNVYHREFARAYVLSNRGQELCDKFHYTRVEHNLGRSSIIYDHARAEAWDKVNQILDDIDGQQFDYWLTPSKDMSFDKFVLPPLMRYYQNGDKEALTKALESVLDNEINKKVVYIRHHVELLLQNDVEIYPEFTKVRVAISKAIKMELEQEPKELVLAAYTSALDGMRLYQINSMHLFAQWRIDELSKNLNGR